MGLIIIIDDFDMFMGGGAKSVGFPHICSILDKISINFLSIFDHFNEFTENLSVVGVFTTAESPIPAPFLRAGRFHPPISLPTLTSTQRIDVIKTFIQMRAIPVANEDNIVSIISEVNIPFINQY
jgi:hypothetical protein